MAKLRNSVKIASKIDFLPTQPTSSKAARPQNHFQLLPLVISHGFGYGDLQKSENLGFWPVSKLGFFHPWANSAQCAQKGKFWKKPPISRTTNGLKSYDPSLESIFDNKLDQVKKFEIFQKLRGLGPNFNFFKFWLRDTVKGHKSPADSSNRPKTVRCQGQVASLCKILQKIQIKSDFERFWPQKVQN